MGVLSDTALLEADEQFRSVLKAATMAISFEVEKAIFENTSNFDEQEQVRYLGAIKAIVNELSDNSPESYFARVRWYVAQEAAQSGAFVKNGSIVRAAFDNDEAIISVVRTVLTRIAKLG